MPLPCLLLSSAALLALVPPPMPVVDGAELPRPGAPAAAPVEATPWPQGPLAVRDVPAERATLELAEALQGYAGEVYEGAWLRRDVAEAYATIGAEGKADAAAESIDADEDWFERSCALNFAGRPQEGLELMDPRDSDREHAYIEALTTANLAGDVDEIEDLLTEAVDEGVEFDDESETAYFAARAVIDDTLKGDDAPYTVDAIEAGRVLALRDEPDRAAGFLRYAIGEYRDLSAAEDEEAGHARGGLPYALGLLEDPAPLDEYALTAIGVEPLLIELHAVRLARAIRAGDVEAQREHARAVQRLIALDGFDQTYLMGRVAANARPTPEQVIADDRRLGADGWYAAGVLRGLTELTLLERARDD